MKINIDILGEKKQYNMIDSWLDVTLNNLQRFLAYQDLDASGAAINTINLFSDIPKDVIKSLSLTDVVTLLDAVNALEMEKDAKHRATFTLEGKKYGFIPSLEDITLGEYADIEVFIKGGVEKNLSNIMSVLFRPVKKESKHGYIIESYDGATQKDRAKLFMNMSAIQVQNSLVFFWSFVNVLSKTFKSSLIQKMSLKEKK
jgi:hypothetical protein